MAKRIYTKLAHNVIKCIFWITLVYGFIIFITVNSSKEFSQEQSNSSKNRIPPPKNVHADKPHSQKGKGKQLSQEHAAELQSAKIVDNKPDMPLTKLCPKLIFPSHLAVTEGWQPVDSLRSMYTFSAYYVKNSRMVFVIGVRPRSEVSVYCQLWRRKKTEMPELMSETKADVRALLDDRGHRYATTIFECFADSVVSTQTYVSLVTRKCDTPLNALQVHSASKDDSPYQRRLTVCVPPLRMNYDKTKEFVKWIEINKLYGVDKFVVFNYSSGPNIARVLDHYSERELTEVVQWRPPMVTEGLPQEKHQVEIEKYGETAALNDCLFRNKKFSEYISNIGINEFIIPHTEDETYLTDMLKSLEKKAPAYHVAMAFLKKNKSRSSHNKMKSPHVTSPHETRPHVKPPHKERPHETRPPIDRNQVLINYENVMPLSKLIISTSEVDFTSVNHAPGLKTITIPHDKMLMHRYPGGGKHQILGSEIDNVLPSKLVNKAQTKVQEVLSNVPEASVK